MTCQNRHSLSIISWRNSIKILCVNENDYQVDSKFTIDSVIRQLSHMVQVLNEPEKKAEMPV